MKKSIQTATPDSRGMVSILVTMIMLLVISLIVLGFAQVARREQRQSLDRNLSTEAYYAAESGINDAIDIIHNQRNGTKVDANICPVNDPSRGGIQKYLGTRLKPDIDPAHGVSYTCLIVNSSTLQHLVAKNVNVDGTSQVLPIHPSTNNPVNTIHIDWRAPGGTPATTVGNCTSAVGTFPKSDTASWTCPYGVLRIDLVPTDTLDRTTLDLGQKTIFFYPVNNGAGPATTDLTQPNLNGTVRPMNCDATSCRVDITQVNTFGVVNYSLRAMAVYVPGYLDISATDFANPTDLVYLKGAQAQIDVTGKAQDVLRRVQVRVSLDAQGKPSNYALESASSICKRFSFNSSSFSIPGDIALNDPNNPTCKPFAPPCPNPLKDIALVLDDSLSMSAQYTDPGSSTSQTRQEKLVQVAQRFVTGAFTNNAQNLLATVPFNSDPPENPAPPIGQPLTNNTTLLNSNINSMLLPNPPNRQGRHCCTQYLTALKDAALALQATPRPGAAQQIVVFISDGEPTDTASNANAKEALITGAAQALKDKGYVVYTIGISLDAQKATRFLQGMASQPTAPYFSLAINPSDLDFAIDSITRNLNCAGS